MKKIKYLLLLLLMASSMLFQACSDDDEEPTITIVGNWMLQDQRIVLFLDGQQVSDVVAELLLEAAGVELDEPVLPAGTQLDFREDGTYTATVPGSPPEDGSWALNSDSSVLTIDAGTDDSISFNVTSLSGNRMVLSLAEEEEIELDSDNDGQPDGMQTVRLEAELTFTR